MKGTFPLVFLGSKTIEGTDDNGKPIAWKSGASIVTLSAFDVVTDTVLSLTVDEGFDGQLPVSAGSVFEADVRVQNRDGRAKFRLLAAA